MLQETMCLLSNRDLRALVAHVARFDLTSNGCVTPEAAMHALGLSSVQVEAIPGEKADSLQCVPQVTTKVHA